MERDHETMNRLFSRELKVIKCDRSILTDPFKVAIKSYPKLALLALQQYSLYTGNKGRITPEKLMACLLFVSGYSINERHQTRRIYGYLDGKLSQEQEKIRRIEFMLESTSGDWVADFVEVIQASFVDESIISDSHIELLNSPNYGSF
jgi:hypothetical protein